MASQGFKDVYSCLACRGIGEGTDEFKCNGCGAYVCQHLVLIDGGMVICFCCYKDQELVWPDWSYTRLPLDPKP
jgi:hypothetical protein